MNPYFCDRNSSNMDIWKSHPILERSSYHDITWRVSPIGEYLFGFDCRYLESIFMCTFCIDKISTLNFERDIMKIRRHGFSCIIKKSENSCRMCSCDDRIRKWTKLHSGTISCEWWKWLISFFTCWTYWKSYSICSTSTICQDFWWEKRLDPAHDRSWPLKKWYSIWWATFCTLSIIRIRISGLIFRKIQTIKCCHLLSIITHIFSI